MPQVVLQPASTDRPRENYERTIETPVPLGRISKFVSDERMSELQDHYDDVVWVWGARPGKNKTLFDKIDPGDIILFYRKGRLISATRITVKEPENRPVALDLWGIDAEDEQKRTFEHIFFLERPQQIDIDYDEFQDFTEWGTPDAVLGLGILP